MCCPYGTYLSMQKLARVLLDLNASTENLMKENLITGCVGYKRSKASVERDVNLKWLVTGPSERFSGWGGTHWLQLDLGKQKIGQISPVWRHLNKFFWKWNEISKKLGGQVCGWPLHSKVWEGGPMPLRPPTSGVPGWLRPMVMAISTKKIFCSVCRATSV